MSSDRPRVIKGDEIELAGPNEKVVTLEGFEFLDPGAVRAQSFRPMSEFMYGGTEMRLAIANLPTTVNATDVLVEFHVNVTVLDIVRVSSTSHIRVRIPSRPDAAIASIRIHRPDGPPLLFDDDFRFLPAPRPTIARVLPQTASIESQSRIRIFVEKFPLISALSDVKVYFQFQNGETASAVVLEYSYTDNTKTAMRNVKIDVMSPIASVREGTPRLVVYHQSFGETNSAEMGPGTFNFIDPLSPQLSRIMGSDGSMGIDELSVPMTGTEIAIMVDQAPRRADVQSITYSLLVGGVVQDIASAVVTEDRQATLVFSTFPQQTGGDQEGLIIFGEAVEACLTDCCSACPSKTVTFNLKFYDDTLPKLTALSDLRGPETGGDLIKLQISNFPILADSGDVLVSFLVDTGIKEYVEGVSVLSSTPDKTELLIVTPGFDNIESDTGLEFMVEPAINAALSVSFFYSGKYLSFLPGLVE